MEAIRKAVVMVEWLVCSEFWSVPKLLPMYRLVPWMAASESKCVNI